MASIEDWGAGKGVQMEELRAGAYVRFDAHTLKLFFGTDHRRFADHTGRLYSFPQTDQPLLLMATNSEGIPNGAVALSPINRSGRHASNAYTFPPLGVPHGDIVMGVEDAENERFLFPGLIAFVPTKFLTPYHSWEEPVSAASNDGDNEFWAEARGLHECIRRNGNVYEVLTEVYEEMFGAAEA